MPQQFRAHGGTTATVDSFRVNISPFWFYLSKLFFRQVLAAGVHCHLCLEPQQAVEASY